MEQYKLNFTEVTALRSIQEKIHQTNIEMGWHDKPREAGTMIALCHSELSEALEGIRKDLMDSHLPSRKAAEVELADCVIRILDLSGKLGYDLSSALAEKHAYNMQRADHKRENRSLPGGKAF